MQDKEIQLKLDPCKGQLRLTSLTAVVGDCVGALPTPIRKGYVFKGWYTQPQGDDTAALISPATLVTEDFANTLYAHWETPEQQKKQKKKKKTTLRTQKRALVAMAILAGMLIAGLAFVEYIVDIYHYTDTDGVTYTIKKKDGVYCLYDGKSLCDKNDDGYYITQFGNQLWVDPDSGEYEIYAVVDVEGTEEVGVNQRVLMFKQLTYDQSSTTDASRVLKKIEVHNQYGDMTFVRGQNNRFYIEGHEGTTFSEQLFAQLSNGCGYTISMQRLENPVRLPDGSIDLSEYGLVPEQREREVTDENGEVKTETYDYVPASYTLTTMTNQTYSVTLGDATVSGAGYYAQYEDRQTIYILSSTNIDAAVLQPIEALVNPMIVYPMTLSNSFNVENFTYRSNIDYTALYLDLVLELTGHDLSGVEVDPETGELPAEVEDIIKQTSAKIEEMSDEAFDALYTRLFKENSKLVTSFSYIELDERQNTMLATLPYKMASDYMEGYYPNSDNISNMMQNFYQTTFDSVIKLGPTDEDLEAYGLHEPAHVISYVYKEKKSDTEKDYARYDCYVQFSAKTEEGIYYAYSPDYDMIVAIPESSVPFLEWEEIDWYEREYFQGNIAFTDRIIIEGAALDQPFDFVLDNSASDQSDGPNTDNLVIYANGEKIDYSLVVTKPTGSQTTETSTYNFRRLYISLLTGSMEGVCELTEEEMAAFREKDDSECLLKVTVLLDDKKGAEYSTRYVVYRFYRYTERKAYMTVELLDSPDAESSPQNAQGHFYVLQSFCDKILADAQRFVDGVEIVSSSKN